MAHIEDALSGYLANELSERERQEVADHLSVCATCRKKLLELQKLDLLLRQSTDLEPSGDFFRRLMSRIDDDKKILSFRKRKTIAILAFAAAFVLLVLILALRNSMPPKIETRHIAPQEPVTGKKTEATPDAGMIAHLDELQNMDLIRHMDDLNELDTAMLVEQTETTK